jgi:ABC-type phosphate transport system permease subunit
MGKIFGFLLVLLASIPAVLYGGWGLSVLWNWFLEPLGAIHLTPHQGIGIGFVSSYFKISLPTHDWTKDIDASGLAKALLGMLMGCVALTIVLVVAWAWHQFI